MLVTDSRKAAVRYKLAFDRYIAEHPECGAIHALVAFSGDVEDPESGPQPFNERNMNPGLKGRDHRDAFDTDEYGESTSIVGGHRRLEFPNRAGVPAPRELDQSAPPPPMPASMSFTSSCGRGIT